MRFVFITYILFAFSSLFASGGGSSASGYEQDCMNANGICSSTNYSFPNTTQVPSYGSFDCMSTSPNPVWYHMQVDQSGKIDFTISQTSGDVDFIIWGPFQDVQSGCNSLSNSNVVDCSYSTAATENASIPNAQSGQVYIMLMTNYANTSGSISFNQTNAGASNAGTMDCNVACDVQNATVSPSACDPANGTYSLTANVSVFAPPTSGNAVFKSSCGDSVIIYPPFNSNISATIPNLLSNGGACQGYFYFSSNPACSAVLNYNAPASCNACPLSASSNSPVCTGDSIKLSVDVSSGVTWTGPNGFTSNQLNPVIPNVSAAASGTYTATYTTGSCTSVASVQVNVLNSPSISQTAPSYSICSGDYVDINLTSDQSNVTFGWVGLIPPNDTIDGTGNRINVPITNNSGAPVTVNFVAVAMAANCMSQPLPIPVTVNPHPVINAGPDVTVCPGIPVTLTAAGAQTYSWTGGIQNGIPFIPSANATYIVTGTNAQGCSATDTVNVTIGDSLVPAFVPSVLDGCTPLQVTFTSSNDSTNHFVWYLGDGTIDSLSGRQISYTYTNGACYDISLKVTSPQGCTGILKLDDLICAYPTPEAMFIPQPSQVNTVDSKSIMINNSTGAHTYLWNFGDGTPMDSNTNPIHVFPNEEPGSYLVTLYATSLAGCVDSMKVYVRVVEDVIFYIPNAFTPDGDEYNNVFKPVFFSGYDPHDFYFRVYNRWGELIFESRDVNYGWDGVYKSTGKLSQEGTYVWTVEFKTIENDERRTYRGHFTLLK